MVVAQVPIFPRATVEDSSRRILQDETEISVRAGRNLRPGPRGDQSSRLRPRPRNRQRAAKQAFPRPVPLNSERLSSSFDKTFVPTARSTLRSRSISRTFSRIVFRQEQKFRHQDFPKKLSLPCSNTPTPATFWNWNTVWSGHCSRPEAA
jgi:hypothetical protein